MGVYTPPSRNAYRRRYSAVLALGCLGNVRYGYVTVGVSVTYGALVGGLGDTYGTCTRTLTSYGSLQGLTGGST